MAKKLFSLHKMAQQIRLCSKNDGKKVEYFIIDGNCFTLALDLPLWVILSDCCISFTGGKGYFRLYGKWSEKPIAAAWNVDISRRWCADNISDSWSLYIQINVCKCNERQVISVCNGRLFTKLLIFVSTNTYNEYVWQRHMRLF